MGTWTSGTLSLHLLRSSVAHEKAKSVVVMVEVMLLREQERHGKLLDGMRKITPGCHGFIGAMASHLRTSTCFTRNAGPP